MVSYVRMLEKALSLQPGMEREKEQKMTKKTLAIAAVVAAMSAHAAPLQNMDTFESQAIAKVWDGQYFQPEGLYAQVSEMAADGLGEPDTAQGSTVAAYGGTIPAPTPRVEGDPIYGSSNNSTAPGSQYLAVDCASPLLRRVASGNGVGMDIGSSGVFVSMLAKFTAFDYLPQVSEGDKLHVWIASDTNNVSQLVVTAAKIVGGEVVRTDYAVDVEGYSDWGADAWHSICLKTYADVGAGTGYPAIVVFIDSLPATIKGVLTYGANGLISINTNDRTVGDSYFYEKVTNPALLAKLDSYQLFPSMVTVLEHYTVSASNPNTRVYTHNRVRHVALNGTGCLDNICVSDEDPIPESFDTAALQISADGGVASCTTSPASVNALSAGSQVTVTITLVEGATLKTVSFNGDPNLNAGSFVQDPQNSNVGTITLTMPSPLMTGTYRLDITTSGIVATVDGSPYMTLADALEASSDGHPAVLVGDYTWINGGEELSAYPYADCVLDLNGHTLQVDIDDPLLASPQVGCISLSYVQITIMDGSAGQTGKIVGPDDSEYPFIDMYGGVVNIIGGTFEGYMYDFGESVFTISGGRFLASMYTTTTGAFSLADGLAEGYMATLSDGYWVVEAGTPGSDWPQGWNNGDDAGLLSKFQAWSATNDATATNAEKAFLLGIDVGDFQGELETTTFTLENGTVVLVGSYNLKNANGAVYVDRGATPTTITPSSTPVAPNASTGAVTTPTANAAAEFYKLRVGYP